MQFGIRNIVTYKLRDKIINLRVESFLSCTVMRSELKPVNVIE